MIIAKVFIKVTMQIAAEYSAKITIPMLSASSALLECVVLAWTVLACVEYTGDFIRF